MIFLRIAELPSEYLTRFNFPQYFYYYFNLFKLFYTPDSNLSKYIYSSHIILRIVRENYKCNIFLISVTTLLLNHYSGSFLIKDKNFEFSIRFCWYIFKNKKLILPILMMDASNTTRKAQKYYLLEPKFLTPLMLHWRENIWK